MLLTVLFIMRMDDKNYCEQYFDSTFDSRHNKMYAYEPNGIAHGS